MTRRLLTASALCAALCMLLGSCHRVDNACRETAVLEGHKFYARDVVFVTDTLLVSRGSDRRVIGRNPLTGAMLWEQRPFSKNAKRVRVSPDGSITAADESHLYKLPLMTDEELIARSKELVSDL